ncbi:MAG: sigma-70 family RNA polymerase sigma factor [Cyanobacteria bacterium Co-bin13]|nr:sigma-70 family RNA polymerase sigma factor [Cyanobacteria bacterium Co-bin13]
MITPESTDTSSDRALIAQCLSGHPQTYRILYQRYQAKVRSTLFQLCGEDGLDDLVQEVFLKAWKGLPQFRQQAQFSTWLYRIAWNVASDQRQRQAKQRQQLESLRRTAEPPHAPANIMHLHYQDLVQRGLQSLSLEHQAVLVLHDLEQIPQKEVAVILAIPVGTVKSRLFHARAAMRQFLEQEGVQP